MPKRAWGVIGGLVITTICPFGQLHAAQEPILRVLVFESKQLRLRADGNEPLLVVGIGPKLKRISTLKIRKKNGQFTIAMNGRSSAWSYLPRNIQLRVSSKDPRGIWLGKRRYRGELQVLLRGDRLMVVNHLGVEKYLASVVGSEMPKSWPMAALKAQAVSARTYAFQQVGKKDLYDVRSTKESQVYLGIESETKSTRQAVDTTRSLVLTHKGRLINAVFHSSSGGETEASGAVWKKQLPYLVSVSDHDQHSPYFQWEKEFDPNQLKAVFHETGGLEREGLQIVSTSATGRILKARVNGPRGSIGLTGKELRYRLGLKSTLARFEMVPYLPTIDKRVAPMSLFLSSQQKSHATKNKSLNNVLSNWSLKDLGANLSNEPLASPSPLFPPLSPLPSLFALDALPPLPSISKEYILLVEGSGSGHGVGMSQWGAHGLAKKGADFRSILTYYYKGVEIRKFLST